MRLFGGPNGSGKTTIVNAVSEDNKIPLYIYVNADDIERKLRESGKLLLKAFNLEISAPNDFYFFADTHGLTRNNKLGDLRTVLKVNRKSFTVYDPDRINSYVAALIADFLRQAILRKGYSFSFETVMSDERKLDFVKKAKRSGYRIYLYFVATISPNINISRVSQRVQLGGHPVDPDVIRKRYHRSLDLLFDMVKLSDRCYLFDNSGRKYELVAEITNGKKLRIEHPGREVPNWFYHFFYVKARKNVRTIGQFAE